MRAPRESSESAPPQSAQERCYVQLRGAIVAGELSPGERLIEEEIGRRLDAPRAAVRAALARLEHDGLVDRERHRGARVRRVSLEEAVEILEARAALESLAAARAAERATSSDVRELKAIVAEMRKRHARGDLLAMSDVNAELHRRVLEISGHATALRLCAHLSSQIVRFQFRTVLLPGRAERSLGEHETIVQAIAAGSPAAAERAMRRHLSSVGRALGEHAQAGSLRASRGLAA